jgi:ATP-dependent DNA helicase RecQ
MTEIPLCPICDGSMQKRVRKRDQAPFWGCSSFPRCKGTLNFTENDEESFAAKSKKKKSISSEDPIFPVSFSNAIERKGWFSEYLLIGSIPSFLSFIYKDKNLNLKNILSQTFLLENSNRERSLSGSRDLISSLVIKILQRGSIPFTTFNVEQKILKTLDFASFLKPKTGDSDLSERLDNQNIDLKELVNSLVDKPGFSFDDEFDQNNLFDSELEKNFLLEWVSKNFGMKALNWFIPQANLDIILESHGVKGEGYRRTDFLFSHPKKTIFIELDGEEHETEKSKSDQERDDALASCGFKVIRIPNEQIISGEGDCLEELKKILEKVFKGDSESPKDTNNYAKAAMYSSNASKLQYAVCLALKYGWLSENNWSIKVLGAEEIAPEAMQDVLLYIEAFSNLYDRKVSPEKIILKTENECYEISPDGFAKINSKEEYIDVVISLEFKNSPFESVVGESNKDRADFVIRSVFLPIKLSSKIKFKNERVFISEDLDDEEIEKNLKIFLKGLYRKKDFREAQSKSITNLLRGIDTVVLLPTGAGKSFIYQISGLLMPGSTIVIDPIVALMEDQVDGLKNYGIDKVISISADNKNLDTDIKLVSNGEYLFILHSPERLQTSKYRAALTSLSQLSLVNLAVLDEAHCVSEWGHDFRPAYLNVSKNIRHMCKDQKGTYPPIGALTGTASRSVLRDVLTDLAIDPDNENSLIRPDSYDRKELNFFISKPPDSSSYSAGTFEGVISSMPQKFGIPEGSFWGSRGEETCSGVVFAPFVAGQSDQTVAKALDLVRKVTNASTTAYAGKVVPGYEEKNWSEVKRENVKAFKNNKTPMLISTKAYGMGIDKPNIRFTLHYGMPSSIEAFYQEAGRAGRDRKKSFCGIIFSEFSEERTNALLDPSKTIEEIRDEYAKSSGIRDDIGNQLFFHLLSFKGIDIEINQIKKALKEIGSFEFENKIEMPFNKISKDQENILQRLVKIGALGDYEKEHGQQKYVLKINAFKLEKGKNLLKEYVTSIAPGRLQEFSKELENINSESSEENILALCDSYVRFTYDFIERARRSAIREMALLARRSSANKDIKQVIQDYLQEGVSVESLETLLQQTKVNLYDWLGKLEKISNKSDANELKGQVIRLLESYPDHPGLLYLRSMTEMLTNSRDVISATNDLKYSVSSSIFKYSVSVFEWDLILKKTSNILGSKSKENIFFILKAILELQEETVLNKEDIPLFYKYIEDLNDKDIKFLVLIKEINLLFINLKKCVEPIQNLSDDKNFLKL